MEDATRNAIVAWCEANPYTLYADYRDEVPAEVVAGVLNGDEDAVGKWLSEVEDGAWPYIEWDDTFAELRRDVEFDDADEEEAREVFDESRWIDTSDYLDTTARYTRLHIVATPYIGAPGQYLSEEDQPEELFQFPHAYCPDGESERRAAQLREVFGIENPEEAEVCYEFDTLKVIGSLNIADVLKNGAPTHITISPAMIDNIVTHNRVNGSGGCGTVRVTKTVTLPAMFRVDDGDRYGVDSVFGFVGEVWRKDLHDSREEKVEA